MTHRVTPTQPRARSLRSHARGVSHLGPRSPGTARMDSPSVFLPRGLTNRRLTGARGPFSATMRATDRTMTGKNGHNGSPRKGKGRKKAKKDKPSKTESNGRDEIGRFAQGNPGGPGRPRRIDLMKAARDLAEETGLDLNKALAQATLTMLEKAEKDGDVNAYKAVADRLAGPVKQELDLTSDNTHRAAPEVPTGKNLAEWVDRLGSIAKNGDSS